MEKEYVIGGRETTERRRARDRRRLLFWVEVAEKDVIVAALGFDAISASRCKDWRSLTGPTGLDMETTRSMLGIDRSFDSSPSEHK